MKKYVGILCIIILNINFIYAKTNLSLDESKSLALQNNSSIQNSLLKIEAARQIKEAAFTKFFPKITANGTTFQSPHNLMEITVKGGNLPVYDGNPANLATAKQFAYFPGISLGMLKNGTIGMINIMQPIYAGGRILNGNQLAALGETACGYQYNLLKNEVLFKTEEQYWQIVAFNEKLKTIQSYSQLLESLLKQVKDAYKAGIVQKNDVLKVEIKRSELKLTQSKLENGIKLSTMAFCQYIGIPYESKLILTDTIAVNHIDPVDHSKALKDRQEYRLLQTAIEAEALQTQIKKGEYLPQVGIGFNELYMQIDSAAGKTEGIIYGTVQIPISDWWEASHTLDEQAQKEQIAKNNLKNTSELLLLQMEKSWQDLTDSRKQVTLSEDVQKQALENLKVNQDSYQNGLSSISDLLEAQSILQTANDQLTESKVQYQLKRITYLQLTAR